MQLIVHDVMHSSSIDTPPLASGMQDIGERRATTFASLIPVIQAIISCLVDTQRCTICFSTLVREPLGYKEEGCKMNLVHQCSFPQGNEAIYTTKFLVCVCVSVLDGCDVTMFT